MVIVCWLMFGLKLERELESEGSEGSEGSEALVEIMRKTIDSALFPILAKQTDSLQSLGSPGS